MRKLTAGISRFNRLLSGDIIPGVLLAATVVLAMPHLALAATCHRFGSSTAACVAGTCPPPSPGIPCYSETCETSLGCPGYVAPPPAPAAPDSGFTFEQVKPTIQIDIPTLRLSDVQAQTVDGEPIDVSIPWIGEYIAALYRWAVPVGTILATVVIMVAGVIWLTSGGAGTLSTAKEWITNAVIGLLLLVGSYVILNLINPELVFFTPLNIKLVKRTLLESRLGTTLADTSGDVGGPTPGSHSPTYTSCPFALNSPRVQNGGGARAAEFYEQVRTSGIINGATVRDRAVQIADAAAACDTNFGSCGRTAGTILALAGVGDRKCLSPASGNCNGNNGPQIHGISKDQRVSIYGVRCDFEGANDEYAKYKRADCVNTASEATTKIRTYLQNEVTAGNLSGWPDQWANDLRPGDYFVVYNGNKDLVGAHAVIFVGWTSDGNNAQVIQGGGAAWKTRSGSICIKSACADRMKPLLYIWTP